MASSINARSAALVDTAEPADAKEQQQTIAVLRRQLRVQMALTEQLRRRGGASAPQEGSDDEEGSLAARSTV